MRRLRSVAGPSLCLAVLATQLGCDPPRPAAPRNFLLITLDTLRADHLGTYGYERPTSPALDAFAAGATVFEDVTCSMPTTLPAHVSIFTGLRPSQHGVHRNGEIPPRDLVTIFDLLEARGAATHAVVASRVLDTRYLSGLGFDDVEFPGSKDQYQTAAERVNERARAWLAQTHGRPFALWLHYYDTHEPYSPPARLAKAFDRGYQGSLPDTLDVPTLVGFNEPAAGAALSAADLAHITDLYDAEIAYLDSTLGRLFEHLDELQVLSDTLVVIVGDHGQALGESSFFGHGLRLLEPVIKVPLIVRLPGQIAGRRVATPVETVDLLPTLAELFDLEAPAGLSGLSLTPALAGEALATPPFRLIERRSFAERPEVLGVALHGGNWKAVFYHDQDGSELRYLGRLPGGLDAANVYDAEASEARWLEAARRSLEGVGLDPASELDEEQRRALRALGYVD
jgi:arylsulfatase A-like enzyme